jgi:hypothetical protein
MIIGVSELEWLIFWGTHEIGNFPGCCATNQVFRCDVHFGMLWQQIDFKRVIITLVTTAVLRL